MVIRKRVVLAVGLAALAISTSALAATVEYDLTDDWSTVQNPFGAWALKKSPSGLFGTYVLDHWSDGSNQHCWADEPYPLNAEAPYWMKCTVLSPSHYPEMQIGDLVVHGAELDRTGSDFTSVYWTSPSFGAVVISGALWQLRSYNRTIGWELRRNGTALTYGVITTDGTYTRSAPFGLGEGSGGSQACRQPVSPGDTIELVLISISEGGNLGEGLAVDLHIGFTPDDPIEWPLAGGGNGHYYHFLDGVSWRQAHEMSAGMIWQGVPGHLATLTSAEEEAWIEATFPPRDYFFIGLHQAANSGEPHAGWIWVTGEALLYRNWQGEEPNNGITGEDYGALNVGGPGGWVDIWDSYVSAAIIEYDTPPLGAAREWPTGAGGNGHSYEFVRGSLSWPEARDAAAGRSYGEFGGHLLTINSQAEHDWLKGNMAFDSWLGAFQPPGTVEPNEGWQWVTGEEFSFSAWPSFEPSETPNPCGEEDYLAYGRDWYPQWNDICEQPETGWYPAGYIVEYEDMTPPSAPVLALYDTETERYLIWENPSEADFQHTCLYRGTSPGFETEEPIHCSSGIAYQENQLNRFWYRARSYDIHGNASEWSNEVVGRYPTAVPGPLPTVLRLYPSQPNPFNPMTTLRFDLPVGGRVHLEVFDVAGRLVRTLLDADLPAGSHQAVWDGTDSAGRGMPSGSYFARLSSGGSVETVRMGLVR